MTLLFRRQPAWVRPLQRPFRRTTVEAAPLQTSGRPTAPYVLEIFSRAGVVHVQETAGGRLPGSCPERHINPDGTLCIGYEAGKGIDTDEAADRWWSKLMVHLLCQETASRTGIWPSYAALSHGDAGQTQLMAEAIGAERGVIGAVQDAMFDRGHIYGSLRLVSKQERRLINGRAACVCGVTTKRGTPVLRRICNRQPDACLVLLEQRRRRQEQEFWNRCRDQACCGSMENCPRRNRR